METKKIVEKLNNFCESFFSKNVVEMDVSLFKEAAERLEELEAEIAELKKQLSEKPEWISLEDDKEMPDAFSYTGIRHNQFPRLVVAIDENSHITHWMMLDAPKPKRLTFKDVFLKAFPGAVVLPKSGAPVVCAKQVFPQLGDDESTCDMCCAECWNQPYFAEGEGEAE